MGLLDRIRKAGPPPVEPEAVPLSVSGRGHVDGFLNLEELNVELQGRQGIEVYDRMFRTDGDVQQVVRLLCNPIIAGTWEVVPAGGEKATPEAQDDADFVRWALFENMSPNLRGHLIELLPVLFRTGFCPAEKVWEVADYEGEKVTVLRSLQLRLPRTIYRWKQDEWGNLEAIEQYLPVPRAQVIAGPNVNVPGSPVLTGPDKDTTAVDDSSISDSTIVTDTRSADYRQTVWLPMTNLVYYRVGAEGDNWEGVSLLRPAYKHWFFKDAIERMDAMAQEREALGLPVCYPPVGATAEQLDAMESILQNIRSNAQGYILMAGPKAASSGAQGFGQGWLLEWMKPGEHGSGRDPSPSLNYHTDKIAAALLAEFLRQGRSLTGGTKGADQFSPDPFLVSVEGFAGLVEDVMNTQIVAPLIAYNRPNAKGMPKVKMSLVDASTLSELADFLLKLIQVGAVLPDQQLENFMRARADLPPSDAEAVRERGDLDASLRREIIMGKNGNTAQEPAGTNGPAGSTTGGSASGTKGVDNNDKAAAANPAPSKPTSAQDAITRKAISKSLSAGEYVANPATAAGPDDAPPFQAASGRERWRPLGVYELNCDLDGIEDHFDSAPEGMAHACSGTVNALARQMAEAYPKRTTEHSDLKAQVQRCLEASYDYGSQTVSDEIERRTAGSGYQLDAAMMLSRGTIAQRAHLGHQQVLDAMHHAIAGAHFAGHSLGGRQRAAEQAGRGALKQLGRTHSPAAFNQGRHDRILDAGDGWGVVYTAILDKNTCGNCRAADDGVVRALDDPVRVENKPPNPHCDSTASLKGNQCRCFEIPEPMDDGVGK